jgi:DNA-binding ferritin-like protein
MRKSIGRAEDGNDAVILNILTGSIAFYEKASWMFSETVSG